MRISWKRRASIYLCCSAVAILGLLGQSVSFGQEFTIKELILPGAVSSQAVAVNRHGHVVGTASWSRVTKMFYYDGSRVTELSVPEADYSPHALGDDDVIVGTYKKSGSCRAFQYDVPTGDFTDLAPLRDPSIAYSVNKLEKNKKPIIVGCSENLHPTSTTNPGSVTTHPAVFWTLDGCSSASFQAVRYENSNAEPICASVPTQSAATGVNARGMIVGSFLQGRTETGFVCEGDLISRVVLPKYLKDLGYSSSRLVAINYDGFCVGYYWQGDDLKSSRAFSFVPDFIHSSPLSGWFKDLGVGAATAISNGGRIVGTSPVSHGTTRATWFSGGEMQELKVGDRAWVLTDALGVSELIYVSPGGIGKGGFCIVGNGTHNAKERAFLLTLVSAGTGSGGNWNDFNPGRPFQTPASDISENDSLRPDGGASLEPCPYPHL